jgi:ABC-type branched-subunit amino acid transport system ATPase component
MQPIIAMQGVNKWYGQFHVLKDIDLDVQPREKIVICGPSGSGKSHADQDRMNAARTEHQQGPHIVVDGVEHPQRREPTVELKLRARSRHGVPALQPVSASDVLENLTLAPMWVGKMPKKEAEERAMTHAEARAHRRAGREVPAAALGRSAAARGDRPRTVPDTQDHAVRRAHLGARPRDDQGGSPAPTTGTCTCATAPRWPPWCRTPRASSPAPSSCPT